MVATNIPKAIIKDKTSKVFMLSPPILEKLARPDTSRGLDINI